MEASRTSPRQLKLFHIENPLSVRLGSEFFRALPSVPGVYFFYGAAGELLYVGQSSDLKARIGSYRHVTPEKNPKRTLRLVHRIARIEWQECGSAAAAIELEAKLLLEHRPPFNRAGVWRGDPWWLKIEASPNKVLVELTREAAGTGPHPAGFRHVVGSLVRCAYRVSQPHAALSAYPHGLFNVSVPLMVSLPLADAPGVAAHLTSYAEGVHEPFLSKLEDMPLGGTALEQEYWQEELERLRKYASKVRKLGESKPEVVVP